MIIWPTISSGGMIRAGEHLGDAFFGREHDRQAVGPSAFNELAVQIFFGVGSQPSRPPLLAYNGGVLFSFGQRRRKRVDDFLHQGFGRDRIGALDVAAQHVARHAHHGIRREAEAQRRSACACVAFHEIRKSRGHERGSRNSEFVFHSCGVIGETRRTGLSTTNTEDRRVGAAGFHFGPEFGIVGKHRAALVPEDRLHGRHVSRKPVLKFLHELEAARKSRLDQVDRLAIQRSRPGRHRHGLKLAARLLKRIEDRSGIRLRLQTASEDAGRLTVGIQDGEFAVLLHVSPPVPGRVSCAGKSA